MAIPYRPRIIKQPYTSRANLMTCKKELAKSLVNTLIEQGIQATVSNAETTEEITTGDRVERYVVSQIDIAPPAEFDTVRNAVDLWQS